MNWADFKDSVRTHLHAYADTQGMQAYIDLQIRAGVGDLQSAVRTLRRRTSLFPAEAVEFTEGAAARVSLPENSFLIDVYARSTADTTEIRRYTAMNPDKLQALKDGSLPQDTRGYIYVARTGELWISPKPSTEVAEVVVSYDTIGSEFEDTDDLLLGESEAEAVAEYVLKKLALNLDKDIQQAQAHDALYKGLKRQIMSDHNEAALSGPE